MDTIYIVKFKTIIEGVICECKCSFINKQNFYNYISEINARNNDTKYFNIRMERKSLYEEVRNNF